MGFTLTTVRNRVIEGFIDKRLYVIQFREKLQKHVKALHVYPCKKYWMKALKAILIHVKTLVEFS